MFNIRAILIAMVSLIAGVSMAPSNAAMSSHVPYPFMVAASNAPQAVKDMAMYVTDGTDDQVEINAAIVAASPGKVILSSGKFNITSSIVLLDNTVLEGQGWGPALDPATDAGATVIHAPGVAAAISATNKDAFRVSNLKVYQGVVGLSVSTTVGGGMRRHFILENLVFNGQGSVGMQVHGGSSADLLLGWRANNIFIRRVDGVGISVRHATDWYGSEWYSSGTTSHGILIRDSASFNASLIRGDDAGPGGGQFNGIRLVNVSGASFTNLSAAHNFGQGVYILSGGTDITITGGWITNNGQDPNLPDYYRTGMTVEATTPYVTVTGVHFYNRAGVIGQSYGMLDIGPTHTVIGNTFHDNTVASVRDVDEGAIMLGNRGIE
jgi:hypothetical protein